MSPTVRSPLETLAPRLAKLKRPEVESLLERRLVRLAADPLPVLARDEDPADIFVDSFHWLADRQGLEWTDLQHACGNVAERWSAVEASRIHERPEPLGELFYLCARVAATTAIAPIANTIGRVDLRPVLLPGGEELKLRALRSLVGLLQVVSSDARKPYQPLFRTALEQPQHRAIAATALLAFWPDRKRDLETWLQASGVQDISALLQQAERNVKLIG